MERIPLLDICAGPKCRFYRRDSQGGIMSNIPVIVFYDTVSDTSETRKIWKETIREGWFGRRKLVNEYEEVPIREYHAVSKITPAISCYHCQAFNEHIWCPKYEEAKWKREWITDDFANVSFRPLDQLIEPDLEPKWSDGSKCPSFVPYPIREVNNEQAQG